MASRTNVLAAIMLAASLLAPPAGVLAQSAPAQPPNPTGADKGAKPEQAKLEVPNLYVNLTVHSDWQANCDPLPETLGEVSLVDSDGTQSTLISIKKDQMFANGCGGKSALTLGRSASLRAPGPHRVVFNAWPILIPCCPIPHPSFVSVKIEIFTAAEPTSQSKTVELAYWGVPGPPQSEFVFNLPNPNNLSKPND